MSLHYCQEPQPDTPTEALGAMRGIVYAVLCSSPFWGVCLGIALWTIYG